VFRFLHQQSDGKIPIIGVGGIYTPEDAIEKLEAGASLLQLYTGFIYEGPAAVKRINKALIGLRS
jgi:dihydroorotate dehydrogenase